MVFKNFISQFYIILNPLMGRVFVNGPEDLGSIPG